MSTCRPTSLAHSVHTYTACFKRLLPIVEPLIDPVSTEEFLSAAAELNTRCTKNPCSCHVALNNMVRQYQSRSGLIDPDLNNVDVAAIFVTCWRYAKDNDELEQLHESMMEIGGTCRQGQSHRLLFLLLAYHELY